MRRWFPSLWRITSSDGKRHAEYWLKGFDVDPQPLLAFRGDRISKVTGWRYVWACVTRKTFSWLDLVVISAFVAVVRAIWP